ncbi:unnamed protein product, partial [Effrenium voratum]
VAFLLRAAAYRQQVPSSNFVLDIPRETLEITEPGPEHDGKMPAVEGGTPSCFEDGADLAKNEIPETANTVLLGECTHGTEEFYQLRAEISQYLMQARGFNVILCESDWTFMWHVNQYVHRKKSKMFPDATRFPDWMWKNRQFYDMVEWMRKRASSDGPYLFGMDCYCKEEAKEEVLNFFDFYDRDNLGKEFRRTLYPVEQPDRWPSILAKLQWEFQADSSKPGVRASQKTTADGRCGSIVLGSSKFRGCSKLDQFNVEQNLECMIAADEYYSKQRLEPPGSRASWNARDQHMMTTILRLRAQSRELFGIDGQDLKIIIWAHNSHVGDATATPMGGMEFQRNEKWNLGQMCRSNLESVFIVGFYSYCGEVRAAKKWGGEGQIMPLSPAVPYSFEHRLHEWFPEKRAQFPLHRVRDASRRFEYVPLKFPLNIEYRAIHPMVRVSKDLHFSPESLDEDLRHKHQTLDPAKSFVAVSRVRTGKGGEVIRLQIRGYDRGQYDGWWVTEYTRYGSRTIHCLPAEHLNALSGANMTPEKLLAVANFPILQRWVGVQYHPETEIESHYGEMSMAKCYDLAVFVDRTQALNTDLAPTDGVTVSAAVEGEAPAARHNRRLLMEYRRILKNPIEYIEARPLDTNILEWHFVITGNQDPYTGGKYHGILEFPDDFPMKPPSIKMLTPSGRFEINKRICLSMSDFHKESWNPSWTVEKILIGLMSFMYEENSVSIGSILEPKEDRRRYAAASAYFNAQNEIYVQLFQTPDEEEEEDNIRKLRTVATGDEPETDKACRYCLVDSGDLVAPCECKGSGQWVHLGCLRQWQKSVLLTQSTHPKYQTRIDEICNVCERPFKEEFKPRSRREALLEYTGEELPQLIQKGNLLASSRPKSEKNGELMRQQAALALRLGHFTEAVYIISLCETYNPNKRGGGAVLGVNLTQPVPYPLERTSRPLLNHGPDVEVATYPLQEWRHKFAPLVQVLQAARAVGQVEHFLGGPVEPSEAFALIDLPAELLDVVKSATKGVLDPGLRGQLGRCFELLPPQRTVQLCGRLRVKGSVYFGELPVILGLLASVFAYVGVNDATMLSTPMKVFWGYASWNATQLLGEIARRGWGLVVTDAHLSFECWDENIASWERVVDKSIVARESEYSI